MWDILLFTGLLLISSFMFGLLPFMVVLWVISRTKEESFSELISSQKITVYVLWMVVGAFLTHIFGGDIYPEYFQMLDEQFFSWELSNDVQMPVNLDVPYRTLWVWIDESEENRQRYDEARIKQDEMIRMRVSEVLEWSLQVSTLWSIEIKLLKPLHSD